MGKGRCREGEGAGQETVVPTPIGGGLSCGRSAGLAVPTPKAQCRPSRTHTQGSVQA